MSRGAGALLITGCVHRWLFSRAVDRDCPGRGHRVLLFIGKCFIGKCMLVPIPRKGDSHLWGPKSGLAFSRRAQVLPQRGHGLLSLVRRRPRPAQSFQAPLGSTNPITAPFAARTKSARLQGKDALEHGVRALWGQRRDRDRRGAATRPGSPKGSRRARESSSPSPRPTPRSRSHVRRSVARVSPMDYATTATAVSRRSTARPARSMGSRVRATTNCVLARSRAASTSNAS